MKDLTCGNVVRSFTAEVCVSKHKFHHEYERIICFEDFKVRFGLGRKSVLEGTNCTANVLLCLVIKTDKTFLGKCDFPGKIVFTSTNLPK